MSDPPVDLTEAVERSVLFHVRDLLPSSKVKPVLPPEFRGLAMLLCVDALFGLWLALHARDALAAYVTPQLPVIGFGSLVWGFLPDEPKRAFGIWLGDKLARPFLFRMLVAIGTAAIVISFFVSSVAVHSVDPEVAANLNLVRGRADNANILAAGFTSSERLNRLTSPVRWYRPIFPFGANHWMFSDTHVLPTRRVKPWIPTVVNYPDDFAEMSTIAVLPDDSVMEKLPNDSAIIRILDIEDSTKVLAQGPLSDHGVFISFTQAGPISSEVLIRWLDWLGANAVPPDLAKVIANRWQAATWTANQRWIPTRRPLIPGQVLIWDVVTHRGRSLASGKLRLEGNIVDLHFSY